MKVSILMAVHDYNNHYLMRSIESILNQSFKDFELVIVDGGSKDGTTELIQDYRDKRIWHIVLLRNPGFTNMLNIAFENSVGDLIARQDGDDISDATRLERQVAFLDARKDVDILGTSTIIIDYMGKPVHPIVVDHDHRRAVRELKYGCPFAHGSVMMRRSVMNDYRYDPIMVRAQDYDLWLRIARDGKYRFAVVPDILYYWRTHPKNVENSDNKRQFLCAEFARLRYYGFDPVSLDVVEAMMRESGPSRRRYLAHHYRNSFYGSNGMSVNRMYDLLRSMVLQPGYWMNELEKKVM